MFAAWIDRPLARITNSGGPHSHGSSLRYHVSSYEYEG
jgi:hypothetical protein